MNEAAIVYNSGLVPRYNLDRTEEAHSYALLKAVQEVADILRDIDSKLGRVVAELEPH